MDRARHTQASARYAQDLADGLDEPFASVRAMHLGKPLERELESNEIIRAEEWRNRQLCKPGRADDKPCELILDVAGDLCFCAHVHCCLEDRVTL
jgi:hypothetical protein